MSLFKKIDEWLIDQAERRPYQIMHKTFTKKNCLNTETKSETLSRNREHSHTALWVVILLIFLVCRGSHAQPPVQDTIITFTSADDLLRQIAEIERCDTIIHNLWEGSLPSGATILDYGDSTCWATIKSREVVWVAIITLYPGEDKTDTLYTKYGWELIPPPGEDLVRIREVRK